MEAKLHYSFYVVFLVVFSIFDSMGQNVFSGEPVQWVGTPNGFSTTPYNSDYRTLVYRRVSISDGNPSDGRGQWATTINVQNSGGNIQPSNMPGGSSGGWLLISGPSGNRFQNKWAFGGVGQAASNSQNTITFQGSTDMGLNMSTPGRYTFVMRDNGYSDTEVYIGYTSNDPVSVSRTGASYVNGQVVISISSSATPSSGERVFVRYRVGTNNFTSSTSLVQATGSGTNWTATLPAQSCGSTIYYYVFTSTRDLSQLNAANDQQRSLATLRYDDAFGANYSISTDAATASVLSGNSTICEGDSTNLQVQITGGISPFSVEISDGSFTFTVNNYISNSPIAVTPDASKSYSLVSVTGSDGCLSAALSGSAAVTVQIPTLWYADVDEDGFGDPDDSIESCDQPTGYVDNNLDCDDSDDSITVAQVWYFDNDGDGFGNDNISQVDCSQPFGYVALGGDCDDTDDSIYPGAPELCYDGILQNCEGALTDGCPQVLVRLRSDNCGATLTSITQTLRGDALSPGSPSVPAGVSRNGYRFRVTNLITNEVREVTTSNYVFNLGFTDIAQYNTTYSIEVAVRLNQEWMPYGQACLVTTPGLPTTQLTTTGSLASCGSTVASMNSIIRAGVVTGALAYEYEVRLIEDNVAVATQSLERPGASFNLLQFQGILPLKFGAEYEVRARVLVPTSAGNEWSEYGAVCSVFTPLASESFIEGCSAETGLSPATLNTVIYSRPSGVISLYRYRLVNEALSYDVIFESTSRAFRLSNFNAISPLTAGAVYSATVEYQLYGFFYDGKDCNITVPGGAKMANNNEQSPAVVDIFDGFKALASPNPFEEGFNINVYTNSTQPVGVAIYDMTGRLLETKEVTVDNLNNQIFGERYPSGVYNLVVTQGVETRTVRVMKQ
jgi:hypothetical protein